MISQIIDAIKAYQTITMYPHQHADGDALGAAFGLKEAIHCRYPEKQLYVLGNHTKDNGKMFPLFDQADEHIIGSSLAIIVDTANHERIDDQRYQLAKYRIKIDHHPGDDNFGDMNYVLPETSSTSELILQIAKELCPDGLSAITATYLYCGVLSDSMSFSTASTNVHTMAAAAELAKWGADLYNVSYYFRAKSRAVFDFTTEMRNRMTIEHDELCYVIVPKELYQKYDLSYEDVKGNVSEFSRISGLYVWAVFLEQEDEMAQYPFQGSLRSRNVIINDVANQFHGGGHKFASGVKLKDEEEVYRCIDALRNRIKEAKQIEKK